MKQSSPRNKALVIIDMQNGLYFSEPPAYDKEHVLSNINLLIRQFRADSDPVIFVQHTGPQGSPIQQGQDLWQLIGGMDVQPASDLIISKHKSSIFTDTPLFEWLNQHGINSLYIAGMKTQYCIDTACRAASGLGLEVILVSDAHTCIDTGDLTAQQIINHHNTTLNGPFAKIKNTVEICGTDFA